MARVRRGQNIVLPTNNLPNTSVPWGRELENTVNKLTSEVNNLKSTGTGLSKFVSVDRGGSGGGGNEGGGVTERQVSAIVAGVSGPGSPWLGSIRLAANYRLLTIATDAPARVRVYASAAQRLADLNRPVDQDPAPGNHGLMLEFVTENSFLEAVLSPTVDGINIGDPPTIFAPITVERLDGPPAVLNLSFTFIAT